jgi:hypothetical protein
MDDESGWNDVLLEVWSEDLRDQVVARIESVTVGRHGWLVRVFSDPEGVAGGLTETVHAIVLAAIRDETGADLEELGSQAAWECYEQVWDHLAGRWADGGRLALVPLGIEPDVVRLIQRLPLEGAVAAAADVSGGQPWDPLWLRGRLRVDVEGLRAYLRLDGGRAPADIHAGVTAILRALSSNEGGATGGETTRR